jgi:hypothetical protein
MRDRYATELEARLVSPSNKSGPLGTERASDLVEFA